jgi:hypothetical protein
VSGGKEVVLKPEIDTSGLSYPNQNREGSCHPVLPTMLKPRILITEEIPSPLYWDICYETLNKKDCKDKFHFLVL